MCCPVCGSRQVGRIGMKDFYCWDCLVEYNEDNEVFYVKEDGSLVQIQPEEVSLCSETGF